LLFWQAGLLCAAMSTIRHSPETWRQARDAYALGATLKDIAKTYGINYYTVQDRAKREEWPTPDRLPPPTVPAAQLAANSLSSRGEKHRLRIAELVEQALAAALPPALNNWQDIERAAKLGDRAFGLENTVQPIVNLAFPQILSSEAPAFIEISTNSSPEPRRDLPEDGGKEA